MQAISAPITHSSGRRTSDAFFGTASPTSRCSSAETSRNMYIAASTIATRPGIAQPQPCWKTPARIRNSPAKAFDPGTASEMTPTEMMRVARIGRPRAIPPRRDRAPLEVRVSITPASRKRAAETKPWFTICSTEPLSESSFCANTPSAIRLI